MKIFAHLSARALGDFAAYALLASSIRELFDDAELYVYYHNDRPYKKAIVSCIRNAKMIFPVPGGAGTILPIEYFDLHDGRLRLNGGPLDDEGVGRAGLILSGSMLNEAMLNSIPVTTLCPPPHTIGPSNDALVAHGLDPSKWIAAVYWKEKDYPFRGNNEVRMIYDPGPYIAVIRHIIENLGGQVVRLGHPTSTELPQLPGVVDLAKVEGSEWLQLYAVSVSRFFISSGSGPVAYGPAFRVPTAVTNQNICYTAWNPHDYIVTQDIVLGGRTFRQTEAFDAGYLYIGWTPPPDCEFKRNTAQQLIAATDEMFHITGDCQGWRSVPDYVPLTSRPNAVSIPIPRRYRRELLIPPSLRSAMPARPV